MSSTEGRRAVVFIRGGDDLDLKRAAAEAASRGLSVVATYAETTRSESALLRLRRDVAAGNVDVVVVTRPADILRGLVRGVELLREFASAGVRVIASDVAFDTASRATAYELLELLAESVAEAAVVRTTMKIGRTLSRGHQVGRPRVRIDANAVRRLLSVRRIAREVGVSYATMRRSLKGAALAVGDTSAA